jgi:multisubunit Na+/H+ antiporter MnhB subunit
MIALDVVIALATILVAFQMLVRSPPVEAAVLFVIFGLLLSLAWVRLEAPDIAMAEAAIGAALTGALLLDAALNSQETPQRRRAADLVGGWTGRAAVALSVALFALLVLAIVDLPEKVSGLERQVLESLGDSGVSHEITAVLLNYRVYDTWLEVVVLLLAVISLLALQRTTTPTFGEKEPGLGSVMEMYGRVAVPLGLLVGGYILWLGAQAPGGAFQAGSLVGAGLILAALGGVMSLVSFRGWAARAALAAGAILFLLAAAATLAFGYEMLEIRGDVASLVILALESGVAAAVALTFAFLFLGSEPRRPVQRSEGEE